MPDYVDILPDPGRPFSQLFAYRIPEALRPAVRVGAQVLVPFGKRDVVGVVTGTREEPERADLKEVEAVFEDAPALPDDALPLARWMAYYYLCELGEAIRPFLPQGATYRIQRFFGLTGEPIPEGISAHPDAGPVVRLLKAARGELSLGALRQKVPAAPALRALRLLKSRGIVAERASLRPPEAKARKVRVVQLAADAETMAGYRERNARRSPARVAVLRAAEAGPLTPAALARRAGVSSSAVQALVKQGMLKAGTMAVRRTPWSEAAVPDSSPPALNPDQLVAVAAINEAIDAGRHESFLL
jgi:primosomal protein N' (replication factor Y)